MADYTIKDITALREKTGAGMMDVKNALTEAGGDVQKAEEIIRIKGLKGIEKRSGREASEGLVAAKVVAQGDKEVGYVVEIVTETDFVAKSPKFIELSDQVLDAIVKADVSSVEQALEAEVDGTSVDELIKNLAATVGENASLKKVARIEGEKLTLYLHRTAKDLPPAIAAFVATDTKALEAAKDVAQHIAAYSPKYFKKEDVPTDIVAKEEEIATQIAKEEGKPEKIIPNIVQGRLNGFFKEVVLYEQPLAKDPKTTVGKHIEATGGVLTSYLRVQLGQ